MSKTVSEHARKCGVSIDMELQLALASAKAICDSTRDGRFTDAQRARLELLQGRIRELRVMSLRR